MPDTAKIIFYPTAAFITLILLILWRFAGDSFVFRVPDNVKVGKEMPQKREVSFLNNLPFERYSTRKAYPTFSVGETIEIDLVSPNIPNWGWGADGKSFRLQVQLNESVTHTYFFRSNNDLRNAKRVSLRITKNSSKPTDAIHQNDWFWLREFYSAEVINVAS